jgi:NadR type nicotinamide-nucleotide adenylyltransferase
MVDTLHGHLYPDQRNLFTIVLVKDIVKVAIIGPECTGKSELSQFLAKHYNTEWVPEYARGYIDNLTRPYQQDDLLTIAHGQLRVENEFTRLANRILFCDTNLYVIKVWSNFKFGSTNPEILHEIATRKYDLYLLTFIDLPWEADPQREHPTKREELYQLYLREMQNQTVPFVEIKGVGDARHQAAINAVENLLKGL